MAADRLVEEFYDGISFNTGADYGPISIGGPFKLFEINFRGALIYEQGNFTAGDEYGDAVLWGLQNVATGAGPLPILTNLNTPNFLVAEAHVPDEISIVNSPASNTAGVVVAGPVRLTWRGQLYFADNTDFYFSTGQGAALGAEWAIDGSFTVIYSPG